MKLRFRYKLLVFLMRNMRLNFLERVKLYFDWKEFHHKILNDEIKNF